jgi:hypothetical protein
MEPIAFDDHKYGVEVAAGDIKVDLAVQRSTIPSRLRKISENFDHELMGELLVSERADGLYVLDGQHRLVIARDQKGFPTVTCEIFSGLSKADEARLFLGRNDRASVARLDRDRNMATYGDTDTLNVQMAVQSAGYVFVANNAEESTFRDRAAGVAIMHDAERKRDFAATGVEHLMRVAQFCARAWGNQERPESLVMRGISKIFVKHQEIDEDRLFERLRGLPPQQLTSQAKVRRAEEGQFRPLSASRAMTEVIIDHYNRGLASDKRLRA